MLYIIPTKSKQAPIRIISFTLKTVNNEQHPCKCMRVDEDRSLKEKKQMLPTFLLMSLKNICKLLVEIHHGSVGIMITTTGIYTIWLYNTYRKITNTQINGTVQLKHPPKSIDEKSHHIGKLLTPF